MMNRIGVPATMRDALNSGLTPRQGLYTDPAVAEREQEKIFRVAWQYAGHTDWVRGPGDHFTCAVGGIPIVVVRDDAGALNAFVNVCRHRFHEVARGRGSRGTLQCPYHGWTYNLDGSLRAAPRSDRECGFSNEDLSLLPVQVDTWGPLIFVNPSAEAEPLAATLGDLPSLFAERGGALDGLVFRRRIEYRIGGNWKLFVENALECYHCSIAHPSFSRTFDVRPDVYRLEAHRRFSTHSTRLRQDGEESPVDEAQPGFHFYFLWPNLFLSADRLQCEISFLAPLTVETSLVTSDYYFDPAVDEAAVDERIELTQLTLNEDLTLIASAQRGLSSGSLEYGRFLPESESLLVHFNELVADALESD